LSSNIDSIIFDIAACIHFCPARSGVCPVIMPLKNQNQANKKTQPQPEFWSDLL